MRIGSRGLMDSMKHNLTRPADQMGRLYSQLSSGRKLEKLSDNPLAAVRTVRAHAGLEEVAARRTVAQQGKQLLGVADGALGAIAGALTQVKGLALSASSSTLSDSERGALAGQVRSLKSTLVSIGNTSVTGQYIFGGSRNDSAPLEQAAGANLPVLYRGNHHQAAYQLRPDEQITVGFTGAQVFNYPDASGRRPVAGTDTDLFSLLDSVAQSIETGDTARLQTLSAQVDSLHGYEVSLRGQTGLLVRQCERAITGADDTELLLKQILVDEESVDYTSAMVELSNLDTAYQAALSLTSQMMKTPNLIDLLS